MITPLFNIKATVDKSGKITFFSGIKIAWEQLTENKIQQLPEGIEITFTVSVDFNHFLNGKNGIVWATSQKIQAEVIQNALLVQKFDTIIITLQVDNGYLYLIRLPNSSETEEVINYIWKGESGLRLKPDWNYPPGETNKSFEHWLSG